MVACVIQHALLWPGQLHFTPGLDRVGNQEGDEDSALSVPLPLATYMPLLWNFFLHLRQQSAQIYLILWKQRYRRQNSNPISVINILNDLGQSLKLHLLHLKDHVLSSAVTYFTVLFKGITSNICQVYWKHWVLGTYLIMRWNLYDIKGSNSKKKNEKKKKEIIH